MADGLALLAGSITGSTAAGLLALPGFGLGPLSAHIWFAAVFLCFTLAALVERRRKAAQLPGTVLDSCLDALRACSTGTVLAIATGSLIGAGSIGPGSIGPAALLLALASVLFLVAARLAVGASTRRARLRGALATPTLIVGAGTVGALLARRLIERPELGLRPIGFLDTDPMSCGVAAVPVLGGPEDLDDVCRHTGARHVILAFSSDSDDRLVELVKHCRTLGVGVSVVPRLYESINARAKLAPVGGLPLFSLRPVDPRSWQFALKHGVDRIVALLALLFLAPLLLAVALGVRFSSPGPVIFRQRRVGRDGRVFELLKFRTMIPSDAELRFAPRVGSAPGGVEGTDRRTTIGRWLRATSLDELPQLVNVLGGEMSLIGPRPERPEFVEQFAGEVRNYHERHRVKSGITGWAQVHGLRGQTSIADRIEWDNYYIENWSVSLDLRILALTFSELLRLRDGRPAEAGLEASDSAVALVPKSGASASLTPTPAPVSQSTTTLVPPSGAPQTDAPMPAVSVPGEIDAPMPALSVPGETDAQVPAAAVASLRLVSINAEPTSPAWFCGYCGESPSAGGVPAPQARVCGACGEGLLLETQADTAPSREEAFLVVDSQLTVQAVSRRAEQALGVTEEDATNLPIAELLVGADAESGAEVSLASMLVQAAAGGDYAERAFVRPRDTFGVRVPVRITSCGPPRAALIVFESGAPQPPRLRLANESGRPASASTSAG